MSNVYSQAKIFHFMDKVESLPLENKEIKEPLHIRIKPTNVCNHNCSYCSYRVDGIQLGKDMNVRDFIPKDKMMEIVEDIISMGVKAVTFSGGGEPFCYPNLLDVVKRLSESDVRFASLTNGSLITGEIAEVFAHHGTWLRVSIDGWDGLSYAKYRGVNENEFGKVIENIRNFKKLKGKCFLGVSVIIDKENAEHIYDLAKLLADTGIDSIKFSPCIVSNVGAENNVYHESIADAVKNQIKRAKAELKDSSCEIFDAYHLQLESFSKPYDWCPYLQIHPVIAADQNVYSCHDKAYNLDCGILGTIKDKSFKNFWMTNKEKFFSIKPSRDCAHHCVVDNKNRMILDYLNADPEHKFFV